MSAKVEQVTYNPEKMLHTSASFIRNYSEYSGIYGTEQWVASFFGLKRIIENQENREFSMKAGGLELGFSGIPEIREQHIGGQVIYKAEEPHFWLNDEFEKYYLPSERQQIRDVTHAIFDEMRDVYKMEPDTFNNKLIFPKEEYAKEIAVFDAVLL